MNEEFKRSEKIEFQSNKAASKEIMAIWFERSEHRSKPIYLHRHLKKIGTREKERLEMGGVERNEAV